MRKCVFGRSGVPLTEMTSPADGRYPVSCSLSIGIPCVSATATKLIAIFKVIYTRISVLGHKMVSNTRNDFTILLFDPNLNFAVH
jgi:hypothetical protein